MGLFSGENMNIKILAWALPFLALPGCKSSDRTLNLPNTDLVLELPVRVQPPGTLIAAFSPDGRYYAAVLPERAVFEVRSYDGKTLYQSPRVPEKGVLPLLFVKGGTSLVYQDFSTGSFKILDWQKSEESAVPLREDVPTEGVPVGTNPQQTMAVTGANLLLPSGDVWSIPKGAKFEGWASPDGAVIKQDEQWTLIRPDGNTRSMAARPALLEAPEKRGPLSLHVQTDTIKHKKGIAYAASLWLEHSGAVKAKAGIVGLEYEPILRFGFVPGHDAVTYFTSQGSVVVPFSYKKPEKAESRP